MSRCRSVSFLDTYCVSIVYVRVRSKVQIWTIHEFYIVGVKWKGRIIQRISLCMTTTRKLARKKPKKIIHLKGANIEEPTYTYIYLWLFPSGICHSNNIVISTSVTTFCSQKGRVQDNHTHQWKRDCLVSNKEI